MLAKHEINNRLSGTTREKTPAFLWKPVRSSVLYDIERANFAGRESGTLSPVISLSGTAK